MFKQSILASTSFSSNHVAPITAVVDTETVGLPPNNLVYDVGVTFINGLGEPIAQYGALVEEIFTNRDLMMQAYFTRKVFTDYPYILQAGTQSIKPYALVQSELKELFNSLKVDWIAAYNAPFDVRAFTATNDKTELYDNVFTQYATDNKALDLWSLSCVTFMQTEKFKAWARDNHHYKEDTANILTNAEIAFSYLENTFAEDHTALSDSLIEANIMQHMIKDYSTTQIFNPHSMHGRTWQAVNTAQERDYTRKLIRANNSMKQPLGTFPEYEVV